MWVMRSRFTPRSGTESKPLISARAAAAKRLPAPTRTGADSGAAAPTLFYGLSRSKSLPAFSFFPFTLKSETGNIVTTFLLRNFLVY